jgi:hypothetical protein
MKPDQRTAIRRCRDNAWTVVKSRKHFINKVYSCNARADDLLLLGRAQMHLANGNDVDGEFAGRMEISEPSGDNPRVHYYAVWGVGPPQPRVGCSKLTRPRTPLL